MDTNLSMCGEDGQQMEVSHYLKLAFLESFVPTARVVLHGQKGVDA